MPSCVISGCKSQYHNADGVQYFSFPLRDSQRCKAWIKAIGKEDWEPTKWTKICSLHFMPNDYLTRPGCTRKILNAFAVPSVSLQTSSHIVTKQSFDEESDEDHKHQVNTIRIKQLPNKETTASPKRKCYILISVDCARRKTQSQNELQESCDSTQSEIPKRKKHPRLKEEKQLTQEVERLEKMILHQQTKIQKFQKILKVLKMRGLY